MVFKLVFLHNCFRPFSFNLKLSTCALEFGTKIMDVNPDRPECQRLILFLIYIDIQTQIFTSTCFIFASKRQSIAFYSKTIILFLKILENFSYIRIAISIGSKVLLVWICLNFHSHPFRKLQLQFLPSKSELKAFDDF